MHKRNRSIADAGPTLLNSWLAHVQSSASKRHKVSLETISQKGPSLWNSFYKLPDTTSTAQADSGVNEGQKESSSTTGRKLRSPLTDPPLKKPPVTLDGLTVSNDSGEKRDPESSNRTSPSKCDVVITDSSSASSTSANNWPTIIHRAKSPDAIKTILPNVLASASPQKTTKRKSKPVKVNVHALQGYSVGDEGVSRTNAVTIPCNENTKLLATSASQPACLTGNALAALTKKIQNKGEKSMTAHSLLKPKPSTDLRAEGEGNDSNQKICARPSSEKIRYTLEEFIHMWQAAEDDFGLTTEDIEDGSLVRAANSRMDVHDSVLQEKAQYGRLLPAATDRIFREVLQLDQNDIFIDIGHGIGNALLQAAYTMGCESRGIEVVDSRNFLAMRFSQNLNEQRKLLHEGRDGRTIDVGRVRFRRGKLEEPVNRSFLSEYTKKGQKGSIKAMANNFNGVFADRCAKKNQTYYLDSYIAGLFALMKPGSVLATLHPLLDLPPTQSAALETRRRHKMKCTNDASFYEADQYNIGEARKAVSWSQNGSNKNDLIVYRYTRLQQDSSEAVFLCSNPDCQKAKDCIPIPATKEIEIDTPNSKEKRIVLNHCDCKISGKVLRRRKRVDYHYL